MHLLIGLGNPGNEYAETRHNTGFLVADEFAARHKQRFRPGPGSYWFAECSLKDTEVLVAKPTTYMNDSGIAVLELVERHAVPLDRLLVICDDFQLPLGSIRIRPDGSDGGHNGLSSIVYHLQSDRFPRLRCGIASPSMPAEKSRMKHFVLERFPESEHPAVRRMLGRAGDACEVFIADGIAQAMNRFNGNPENEVS